MVDIRFKGIGMFIKRRLCLNPARIIVLILSVWTCSFQLSWAQTDAASPNILILNSYDFGLPAYRRILQMGMETSLRAGGFKEDNMFVEFMKFESTLGPDPVSQLNALIQKRYANHRIEMIVMDFMSNIPMVVMLGPQSPDGRKAERPVMFAVGRPDMWGTLNSAIGLLPDTRRVLVIHGPGESDRNYEIQARKEFEAWTGKLEFEFLSNLPMEEMLRNVAEQPPQTVIIYLNFSRDVTGRPFMPRAVLENISRAANRPVFGLYDILLDRGIVGGSLLSFQEEGARAGKIAFDILKGKIPAVPPQNQAGTTKLMFDWKQLNRWGLSGARMPANSIVINRPDSLWMRYKAALLATVGFILVLCAAIVILFLNVLKRRRAEEALRKSEANYRMLFESASDGITVMDRQGLCVDANVSACRMFGYGDGELIGKRMSIVYAPSEKSPEETVSEIVFQLQELGRWSGEVNCWKKDHTPLWCHANVSTFNHTEYGEVFMSVYSDITERKKMIAKLEKSYQQLRVLNRRWVDIEEIERKRLSAELHDEIGQNLTALGINFAIIQMSLPAAADSVSQDRIDESIKLLNRTTTHIKGIMSNLRPTILDEYGLVPALHWYAQENTKRSGIKISFSADELPYRPVAEIETALFRIASEAINNSLKHAGANSINLTLNYAEDRLRLVITDDGAGFEMEALQGQESHGWGLMIMEERCVGIKGLFDIQSTPGQGTKISVEVPL